MQYIPDEPLTKAQKYARTATIYAEIAAMEQRKTQARELGLPALVRLVKVAQGNTGQSAHIGRFLLSLYNGRAYPLDPSSLRCIDYDLHQYCLCVLAMDYAPEQEVHELVVGGHQIWEQFKARWGKRS
ncbi:DUF7673 family protein [Halopseudomonas sp.]|uniref:DUF7673 family protein n=1 Tax=Halopseudomonas sp. TaxID=2901191 RepID=UPI00300217F3